MPIGPLVRRGLGPLETPAARLYRSVFTDLAETGRLLASLGQPKRVLEIGGGDGMLATTLHQRLPDAEMLSIDISPEPGRLFEGDRSRVTFRSMTTADLVAERPDPFDLVVLVDVIHHVPPAQRDALVHDAHQLTAPGGLLAVKDWERRRNPAHALAYVADRYVGGDTGVAFETVEEIRQRLLDVGAGDGPVVEARIPPWKNNFVIVRRRA